MKWQTKNHLGEVVTWYSEDAYNKLERKLEKIKEICEEEFHSCVGCGGTYCDNCENTSEFPRCREANILGIIIGEDELQKFLKNNVEQYFANESEE